MEAKITSKVHYIGVNDRTTQKFEGMLPLPYGVSYNSYIVVGSEKSAIIDGVEVSHALQQIDAIKRILGDRHPDYLVINHMEPDHSGAIRILRQFFPGLKVVGNAQTLAMVKGYYGVDEATLTVKDGDELSLGNDVTLRFVLTPMVHWPETMVTYFKEDRILFSGDAFGCFGALNGAVVDHDMNVDHYFPEMVRYYSNIVGKYGAFVQKAMKKLDGVEINAICSTHGPVWKDKIADVMHIYDTLSRYEALDSGATVIYGSMYGNTTQIAEAVAEGLAAGGLKDISVLNASITDISYIISDIFRHNGLVIVSPTYSDGLFPPIAAVAEAMAVRGVKNKIVSLMGSHTWSPQSVKALSKVLEPCGLDYITEPLMAKHSPTSDILDNCRAIGVAMAHRLKS